MPPRKVTFTIDVEDSEIPTESVTVAIPYIPAARSLLKKGREHFTAKNEMPLVGFIARIDNLAKAAMGTSKEDRAKRKADLDMLIKLYEDTETAYRQLFDFLELTFVRMEAEDTAQFFRTVDDAIDRARAARDKLPRLEPESSSQSTEPNAEH